MRVPNRRGIGTRATDTASPLRRSGLARGPSKPQPPPRPVRTDTNGSPRVAPLMRRRKPIPLVPVPDGGAHTTASIPRKLVQTWHAAAQDLPPRVVRKARAFAPGFVHAYFSDRECMRFLARHYGRAYAQKFRTLQKGPHKADFFRYCYLYVHGGVYMDIDMEPKVRISEVMAGVPPGTLITCLESNRMGIFQAFIAAPPKHPVFKTLIAEFFSQRVVNGSPPFYTYFTQHMGRVLASWKGERLRTGLQRLRDGSHLYLLHERQAPGTSRLSDIYVMKGHVAVFRSRYPNYRGDSQGARKSHF